MAAMRANQIRVVDFGKDGAMNEILHHIETALEAAQSYILGDTPESMSPEMAREQTLAMIRAALLKMLPEVRTALKFDLPPQRPDYQDAKPLTNYAFAAYASRIAQKSADWAAGALQTIPEDVCDPIRATDAARFIAEIRGMLDHIEQQVGRS
jgi:hypothetical protein